MKRVLFFSLIILGALNLTGCKELGIKQLMKQGASPAEILWPSAAPEMPGEYRLSLRWNFRTCPWSRRR